MLLPAFDALKTQLDANCRFARFQWLDANQLVTRPAFEQGRRIVEQHQPHLSLVDFTNLPAIGSADEMWLSVHWFPHIIKLPFRQVAIVSRPEHLHNQMILEALFLLARPLIRFQMQLFDDVPSALEWLLASQPAALQALQAEWDASLVPLALAADA